MSGNTSYHSVQNFLSSSLLSKNIKIKIYRIIILPVVLYESETCSLILREERRLRVFETRVLRRIFGSKRDNIKFNDLYSSPNNIWVIKSRRMTWVGHVACIVERGVYRVLVGKPEGNRPLGRPRHRWMDNIKMDLHEGGMGSIDLAQDRDRWQALVNAVLNLQDP